MVTGISIPGRSIRTSCWWNRLKIDRDGAANSINGRSGLGGLSGFKNEDDPCRAPVVDLRFVPELELVKYCLQGLVVVLGVPAIEFHRGDPIFFF